MKLIEKKIMVDADTFQPIMRVTLDIPIEVAMDISVKDGRECAANFLGEELLTIMEAK